MQDLNSLKIFKDVVSAGGYSAAHRKTGQSRATLSRHVSELEERLGSRLIERSTRSFKLTEQGQILYQSCVEIFDQLDDALITLEGMQKEPSGHIRIAIPPSLLHFHDFSREIIRYMGEFPKVSIQIEVTNRQVDIQHEGFDFVIRARSKLDYPLDFVPVILAKMQMCIVVHPMWKNSITAELERTLNSIPAIVWKGQFDHSQWSFLDKQNKTVHYKVIPKLIVDDMQMMRQAALNQLGLIMIPKIYVQEDVASGQLILIQHHDLFIPESLVHVVHLGHKGMRPAVRHLLNWLKDVTVSLR